MISKETNKVPKEEDNDTVVGMMQKFQMLYCFDSPLKDLTCDRLNELLHVSKNPYTYVAYILYGILHFQNSARSLIYLIERTNFFNLLFKNSTQKEIKPYYTYMYVGGLLVRFNCIARSSSLQIPVRDFFGEVGSDVDFAATVMCTTASMINHSCEPNCIVL